MDVHYAYRGQGFVWDSRKAVANRTKHSIAFEVACEVFFDRLSMFLDATDGEEERQAVVGLTEEFDLLYVVHMEREDDSIRIIPAREATAGERRQYENGG